MWGDPLGAATLNQDDSSSSSTPSNQSKCRTSLLQVTGPAHIPKSDSRWQELFLCYEILVHLERGSTENMSMSGKTSANLTIMDQACGNIVKHCRNNSNIATFAWHVTRMLKDLSSSCLELKEGDVSQKISLVGKSRVVCGALNLFRILVHEVIVAATSSYTRDGGELQDANENEEEYIYNYLQEAFTFTPRGKNGNGKQEDMAEGLLSSILSFITIVSGTFSDPSPKSDDSISSDANGRIPSSPTSSQSFSTYHLMRSTPELYDATVLTLNLVNILFSTQLYQPMVSSIEYREAFENGKHQKAIYGQNFFLDKVMHSAFRSRTRERNSPTSMTTNQYSENSASKWTSLSIMESCLRLFIDRPYPPERSISAHMQELAKFVATDVKGEKVGVDGMYENYAIVLASADGKNVSTSSGGSTSNSVSSSTNGSDRNYNDRTGFDQSSSNIFASATNRVINLSSTLLLLPFRLMTLALRALGQQNALRGGKTSIGGYDKVKMEQLQAAFGARGGDQSSLSSVTNDVLWLSDSPVADMSQSFFLVLVNNYRGATALEDDIGDTGSMYNFINNPFRSDLASLDDNRWEGWNDNTAANPLEDRREGEFEMINHEGPLLQSQEQYSRRTKLLTTNFEHLFESFAKTVHNEVGALMLYTILQSSPIFAASLAVRSDLDMLVIPLLRTLYFSSSSTYHISGVTTNASNMSNPTGNKSSISDSDVEVQQMPFRSPSQLYVILILLLIFSQDTSFGPDSFRRSSVSSVMWYKERKLRDISLGSLIVLSLLRSITFNLNRMQDPFLLSNCCAVLLNLSPHMVDLHSYASMRLASVLMACMKRYTVLVSKNGGKPADEGDVSSVIGMHAEVSRILLQVVKHCLRRKCIDSNLHLVYALVYHQREFHTVLKSKRCPFVPEDTEKIKVIILAADKIIEESSARTADRAMNALKDSSDELKGLNIGKRERKSLPSSDESFSSYSDISDSTVGGVEDFRFTYEEEQDPEIFFLPYVWEIVVSIVTSSSLEWSKRNIKIFAISNSVASGENYEGQCNTTVGGGDYAEDIADVV